MGQLRILGYGILGTIAVGLLVVMCAILKASIITRDVAGRDHAEGRVIRLSAPVTVSRISAAQ